MGRTSGAAQQAKKTFGDSLRHKTVKIGLKNLIRDQSLVPHFFRTSQAVGIVRFFVAVLANRAVSRFLVTTNGSDGETLQVSQSWFVSLMAIVRGVFKGRMPKLKSEALDPVKDDACSLLADFGDVKTWCNQKVDGVYTDVFHAQLASEMMTSAEEHVLRNFEKRLDRHFRTVILDVFSSGNQDIEYRMLGEIAMRASKACLAPTEDDSWKASLLEQIESMVNQAETASNHIIEEIRAQRFQLESYGLLKAHSWKNKNGETSLSSELASVLRIGYNVIATDRRSLFFNRMLEYTARLSLVQSDRLDRLRQELSQEQSSPADASTPNPVRKVDFTRSHRPTPFSALPYYRLKPAQVMYSFSQYSALVKQIVGTVKLGKRKRRENMKPPEHTVGGWIISSIEKPPESPWRPLRMEMTDSKKGSRGGREESSPKRNDFRSRRSYSRGFRIAGITQGAGWCSSEMEASVQA